jgi:hypothetical protein
MFRGLNFATGDTLESSNLDTQTEDEMLERSHVGDQSKIADGVRTLDRHGTPTIKNLFPATAILVW